MNLNRNPTSGSTRRASKGLLLKRTWQFLLQIAVAAGAGLVAAYAAIGTYAVSPGNWMPEATLQRLSWDGSGASSPGLPGPDATVQPARAGEPVIVSYRAAVARAAPSVVTVHSAHASAGLLPLSPQVLSQSLASGVVIESDGYIVTNFHVIADASELAVSLPDGTMQPAKLVGADAKSDLALLKIDVVGLKPMVLADINDVAVGDVVLAIGNPLGIGQTVTQGIVSAVVRRGANPVDNYIQTDAAINPGNSGGPLTDTAGRLVGINTLILSHAGGAEGIGFAIPVDLVHAVAANLKAKGRVARGWLGLSTGAEPSRTGARVIAVERDGPAERAGIAPGDVIVRVGEADVKHAQDVTGVVIGAEPGTHISVDIVRNGERTTRDVVLSQPPAPPSPR
ncbi:MAG: trypsin-like peptidase domain-containing protein [Burkholderiales bacterium]